MVLFAQRKNRNDDELPAGVDPRLARTQDPVSARTRQIRYEGRAASGRPLSYEAVSHRRQVRRVSRAAQRR